MAFFDHTPHLIERERLILDRETFGPTHGAERMERFARFGDDTGATGSVVSYDAHEDPDVAERLHAQDEPQARSPHSYRAERVTRGEWAGAALIVGALLVLAWIAGRWPGLFCYALLAAGAVLLAGMMLQGPRPR